MRRPSGRLSCERKLYRKPGSGMYLSTESVVDTCLRQCIARDRVGASCSGAFSLLRSNSLDTLRSQQLGAAVLAVPAEAIAVPEAT